jgi:hypothetical protein
MSSNSNCIPASVDLSRIPREYDGLWIVVRRSDQAVLGAGRTSKQAMDQAGLPVNDPDIVVSHVPEEHAVLVAQPK